MGTLTRLRLGAALTMAVAAAGCSNSGTASTPDLAMAQDLATGGGTDSGGFILPDIGPLADLTGSPVVRLSSGFAQPFGAFYDTATSAWYVSNVAGDLTNFQNLKDGHGWITKISADYKTVDHNFFATGLSAPAGLRVVGGKLYVPDVDQLVVIDVASKAVVRSATVTPANPFFPYVIMTDVVVDSGVAYVPETIGSRILKFATPLVAGAASSSYPTSGGSFTFPTTLYIDNSDTANLKLVVGTTGDPTKSGTTNNLFTMKLSNGSGVAQLGTFAANFQGIEMDGTTNYLVGTVRGHTVNKIAATGGASTLLVDTAQQGGVAAGDIGWDSTRRILAVPDTGTNCVYFYQM